MRAGLGDARDRRRAGAGREQELHEQHRAGRDHTAGVAQAPEADQRRQRTQHAHREKRDCAAHVLADDGRAVAEPDRRSVDHAARERQPADQQEHGEERQPASPPPVRIRRRVVLERCWRPIGVIIHVRRIGRR